MSKFKAVLLILIFITSLSCIIAYIIKCYKDLTGDHHYFANNHRGQLGRELSQISNQQERDKRKKQIVQKLF